MANNNIERLNKYVEDYLYKCFEEYSQFKYTYEELIGDHDSLEDYIIDEVLESFTNGCEKGGFAFSISSDFEYNSIDDTPNSMLYMINYIHRRNKEECGEENTLEIYSIPIIIQLYCYWYSRELHYEKNIFETIIFSSGKFVKPITPR